MNIPDDVWALRFDTQGRMHRFQYVICYGPDSIQHFVCSICVHDPKAGTAQSRINTEFRWFLDEWIDTLTKV